MTLFLRIALIVLAVGGFVPLEARLPSAGLDTSWVLGMNQAVSQGLQFGREMVFTYGPYAAVATRGYHPATDALVLVLGAVLGAGFAAALLRLSREASTASLAFAVAVLAAVVFERDALMFGAALAAGLACLRDDGERPSGASPRVATIAALCLPLGLLPLVKGSMIAPCGAVVATVAAILVLRGEPRRAAAAVAAPVAGALVAWVAAGQEPASIVAFFTSLAPIISGYTEAMSLPGSRVEPAVVAAASAVVLAAAALAPRGSPATRLAVTGLTAVTLFIAFKSSFVRHDAHALIAGEVMLLACALLSMTASLRVAPVAIAAAALGWAYVGSAYQGGPAAVPHTLRANLGTVPRGLAARLSDEVPLRTAYDNALAALRTASEWPVLPGTVDVYSHDQASLIASGNRWSPRPVLQSYSAYTPALAELNRAHLTGPRAPDHLVFRVEPIDGRLPALEDGASWPVLMSAYEPVRMIKDAVLLRRRANAQARPPEPFAEASGSLGERIAVPASDGPLFAWIDVRPGLQGRVSALLYKPAPLRIDVELEDGSRHAHRFVSGMGAAGFVVSPWVASGTDFAMLYGDPGLLAGRRVVAFTLSADAFPPRVWRPRIEARFARLDVPPPAGRPEFLSANRPLELGSATVTLRRCDLALDALDGRPPKAGAQPVGGVLRLSGWMTPDRERGTVAQETLVLLEAEGGARTVYSVARTHRPDVAAHFGRPTLADSGYAGLIDVSTLSGPQAVRLGLRSGDTIEACEQVVAVVEPRGAAR